MRIDQGKKFGIQEPKAWQAKKNIKIEFNVLYSLKINEIAEKINNLIISKAHYLLFDSNLGQFF